MKARLKVFGPIPLHVATCGLDLGRRMNYCTSLHGGLPFVAMARLYSDKELDMKLRSTA